MIKLSRNERGIALALSIVALVMMGALVAASFTPSLLEQRTAENQRRARQAFEAAEYGLADAIENWDIPSWNVLRVTDSVILGGDVPSGTGGYATVVKRLSPRLYLVDVTGTDGTRAARQRLGQFFRLFVPGIDIRAALTVNGPIEVGGAAEIDGADARPAWPFCPPADTAVPGLRLPDESELRTTGARCEGNACITGNPSVLEDPTVTDSTFFNYADTTWDELVAMATKVVPPGSWRIQPELTAAGTCDVAELSNWGEPLDPSSSCFNYVPIVYATGNLNVNGYSGQGILLVEGDLSVQGSFEHFGITVIKGNLRTFGTGGHFHGAVLAANVELDEIDALGDALVQYSSCAIERALTATSPGRPLPSRSWLHTY